MRNPNSKCNQDSIFIIYYIYSASFVSVLFHCITHSLTAFTYSKSGLDNAFILTPIAVSVLKTNMNVNCKVAQTHANTHTSHIYKIHSTTAYNAYDYVPQITSNANNSTMWKSSMALSASRSFSFSMNVLLIRSNVSLNFSSILK